MLTFRFNLFKWLFFFCGGILLSAFSLVSQEQSTGISINVIYPWEGKNIGNVTKSFVFGNVSPYIATITVNGEVVFPHPNGAFLAYVSISSSSPYFLIEAGGSVFKRGVVFPQSKKGFTEEFPFELISSTAIVLRKGSDECIRFKGMANTQVKVVIDGIASDIISDDGGGLFEYCFKVRDNTDPGFYSLKLKYLSGELKGKKLHIKDFLNVVDGYYLLETSTDNVVLKNDANGYIMFLPPGVMLLSDMYDMARYRIVLDGLRLYVDKEKVAFKRKVYSLPKSKLSTIRLLKRSPNSITARVYLSSKVPFAVWEDEKRLFVEMHNSASNINWIVYDSSDEFVNSVLFRQVSERRVLITFDLKRSLWGYDLSYSTDSTLDIEMRFKPDIAIDGELPLKGLNVIIDPGHSPKDTPPYDGARGPLGSYEYAVNLEIAKRLYDLFLSSGANVYMTRYTNNKDEIVPLAERPRIAKRLKGDIYLSIHNNAIADGEDPFAKPRGFQIYYYHLHSKKLAQDIHRSFIKNIPLPDEGLRYGDYMVARITQMPSVLIENAYLILPQHEEMLLDPLWQKQFAKAIFEGVIEFLKKE